jgi:hypothetical protein
VDPDLRSALLGVGIAFCAVFGGLTLYALFNLGLSSYGDLLGIAFLLVSFGVIALIGIGLYGAMKNPPSGNEPAQRVWPPHDDERDD